MLGWHDPEELLAAMSEDTFRKWQLFWSEEPFGPQVETMMAAGIAAAAAHSSDPDAFLPLTVDVDG